MPENIPLPVPPSGQSQTAPKILPTVLLPALHNGEMLPPFHCLCAVCFQYYWARLPRFPRLVLCTFCYPPPTWATLLATGLAA